MNQVFAGSNIFRTIVHKYSIPNTTREVSCAIEVDAILFRSWIMDRITKYLQSLE